MKKLIIISGIVFLIAQYPVWCLSATPAKTVEGKINAVSLADADKGTKSEVEMQDRQGRKYLFLIKETTRIYDTNASPITLGKLTTGARVRIKYLTSDEGVNEALSLKIIKTWIY
jgi:hypothetical protein